MSPVGGRRQRSGPAGGQREADAAVFGFLGIGRLGVSARGGPQWATFIPRSEVVRLVVARTSQSDRPRLTAAIGVAFLAPGLVLLALLLSRLGERPVLEGLLWASTVAGLGVVFLVFALVERWVLVVHTRKGVRKLVICGRAPEGDVVRFVTTEARRHGYPLTVRGLGSER